MTTAKREEAETENGAPSVLRRMLNEEQVLRIIPVSRTTLFRLEKAGRFPRSTYISPNRRVWFEDEIVAWQSAVDEFNPKRGRARGVGGRQLEARAAALMRFPVSSIADTGRREEASAAKWRVSPCFKIREPGQHKDDRAL
jgi:prophage regulatory protein